MFTLTHHSYCGMSARIVDADDCIDSREDIRQRAADRLRRYRKRFRVTVIARGRGWEILEPEDAAMVPDTCGTLSVGAELHECGACGQQYHWPHESRDCCYGMSAED